MKQADSSAQHAYVLGGYEIEDTAGAGGMGVVYKGVDRALGRAVAIKVLKDELQAHPAVVARFRREAEAIATLNHANIVRIYAVGDKDSLPYIVMEYIDGRPLSDILVDSGSLPWEEALDIGSQIASALVCAHDCQVIHRDIKPANILITKDGSVKVTDFGIAKVLNASTQLTVDGARIGTPQYMCPERCRNLPISPSSDIYSLGVLLFQSITGRLPFEATSASELIGKISQEVPRRVRSLKPGIPEPVDRLIAYMLEKEAADRPPDSRALKEAIDRVRRGERVSEVLPAMDAALGAVRAETPPPTPPQATTTLETTGWLTKLSRRWFATSRVSRILLALALPVGVALLAVGSLANRTSYHEEISAQFQMHGDLGRWTDRKPLATFITETDTIVSGTITLEHFQIETLHWIGGADGAAALLQGEPGSPRDGQMALLTINPYLNKVNVSLPPRAASVGGTPAVTLLGTGLRDADTPGMLMAVAEHLYFLGTRPGAVPQQVFQGTSRAAILDGTHGQLAIARSGVSGADKLVLIDISSPTQVQEELALDGTVRALAFHESTGRLAVLSQSSSGDRLDVLETKYIKEPGNQIREGSIALGSRPFSESGGKLVFVEAAGEDGLGRATVQSLYNRHDQIDLGPAQQVDWRPGKDEALVLAPDHAGRSQLWLAQTSQQGTHEQLTHLDTGVGAQLTLSDDGAYVLMSLPTSNTFAIVDLAQVPQ
jgi:predicted Ser/Thr protein kinase